ncbi:MAG: PepSY domain-containing protein [Nitrospira sp.]|nr:PepSY domain-containing protein [Nitrospira sp.]
MKDSFTQSMDWLHTWGGLIFGWLLFAIFLTGTLTVFDKEITYWMQPELHYIRSTDSNIDAAVDQLARLGPDAKEWWIEFPHARSPKVTISWQGPDEDEFEQRYLDPGSGEIVQVRESMGGDFFYQFHYQLHLDRPGVWIVGAAAMVMLVALVSGIVIHRRFFKDFFTFRPRASSHRAWLDIHNVTSVLVLPFHFMITFTGLVIFWTIYMPAGLQLFYHGESERVQKEMEQRIERARSNSPSALISLRELEQRARAQWNGGVTEWIEVQHPGDRNVTVLISRRADDRLALVSDRVTFDGTTGEILQIWQGEKPAFLTYSVLIGLHYILFDQTVIRWLYFGMGLAASAMIATGLVLWTVKRRERASQRELSAGYRLVEALNVSAVAGLLVAVASFFWVNRLLPMEIPDRALWEMRSFFLAWGLCAIHGVLRRDHRSAWKEQLMLSAILFGFLPLLNLVTSQSHVLVTLPHGNWRLAGVDLTGFAVGAVLGLTAWRIGRPSVVAAQVAIKSAVEAEQQ